MNHKQKEHSADWNFPQKFENLMQKFLINSRVAFSFDCFAASFKEMISKNHCCFWRNRMPEANMSANLKFKLTISSADLFLSKTFPRKLFFVRQKKTFFFPQLVYTRKKAID